MPYPMTQFIFNKLTERQRGIFRRSDIHAEAVAFNRHETCGSIFNSYLKDKRYSKLTINQTDGRLTWLEWVVFVMTKRTL